MSDDVSKDEMVSQFMAFTGISDPARAASYIEMGGNNLEMAVGLYMEHEQGPASPVGGGGAGMGAGGGGGGLGSDAAAAAAAADFGGLGDDDNVRAPDATRTMRLMDDGMMVGGMMSHHPDPALALMHSMMDEQLAAAAAAPAPTAFGSSSSSSLARGFRGLDARAAVNAAAAASESKSQDSDDMDILYSDEGKESNGSNDDNDDDGIDVDGDDDDDDVKMVGSRRSRAAHQQPARLSDMFAAPTHLMHKAGGFQGARAMAKDSKRWLLVNIQRDSEFATHALNRDVWRDELVENLVREGFIFWQQMDMTPEGTTYIERYQVQDYPHLAIIDPRTGRLLWRKEGWTQENPMTASLFAEIAMDFCSRNSFDRPPQAPRPPGARPAAAASANHKRPMHEMSEDEQLQAAMRASMQDAQGSIEVKDDDDDDEVEYIMDDDDDDDDQVQVLEGEDAKPMAKQKPKEEEEQEEKEEEEKKPPSLLDSLLALDVGDEPAGSGARVQIKMPDGKRSVRKFDPARTVRALYAFVAQSNEEARGGREFVLMSGYPPNDLINDIDSTIEETKLSGQVVTVRWK